MRGNRHQVTVDGKTFWVDSNQEETLIRWAEANGFHDRWMQRDHGVSYNGNNYTPDLELSVQLNGMTHRALVESKPYLKKFTPYVSRRMRGIAKHYFTDLLLLYTHDTNSWYRVDVKTGKLSNFGVPMPGKNPISTIYSPWTKKAPKIYARTYRQRIQPMKIALKIIVNILEDLVHATAAPKQKSRRRKKQ